MMAGLKTLKDLQKDYEWKFDTYNALKQEAIKWIKDIKMNGGEEFITFSKRECEAVIRWIKVFFDITEEECKMFGIKTQEEEFVENGDAEDVDDEEEEDVIW